MAYEQERLEMMLGMQPSARVSAPLEIRELLLPEAKRLAKQSKKTRPSTPEPLDWTEAQQLAMCIAYDHHNARHRADLYDRFGTGTRWRKAVETLASHGMLTTVGACTYRYKIIMDKCRKTECKMNGSGGSSDYENWYYKIFSPFYLKHCESAREKRRYVSDNSTLFGEEGDESGCEGSEKRPKLCESTETDLFSVDGDDSGCNETQKRPKLTKASKATPSSHQEKQKMTQFFPIKKRPDGHSGTLHDPTRKPLSHKSSLYVVNRNKTQLEQTAMEEVNVSLEKQNRASISAHALAPALNASLIVAKGSVRPKLRLISARYAAAIGLQSTAKVTANVNSGPQISLIDLKKSASVVGVNPGTVSVGNEDLGSKPALDRSSAPETSPIIPPVSNVKDSQIKSSLLAVNDSEIKQLIGEVVLEVEKLVEIPPDTAGVVKPPKQASECGEMRSTTLSTPPRKQQTDTETGQTPSDNVSGTDGTKAPGDTEERENEETADAEDKDKESIHHLDESRERSSSESDAIDDSQEIMYEGFDDPVNFALAPERLFSNADRCGRHNKTLLVEPKFSRSNAVGGRTIRSVRLGDVVGFDSKYLMETNGHIRLPPNPNSIVVVARYDGTKLEGFTRLGERVVGLKRVKSIGFLRNVEEFETYDIYGSQLAIKDTVIRARDIYAEQPFKIDSFQILFTTDVTLFCRTFGKKVSDLVVCDVLDMRHPDCRQSNIDVCDLMAPVKPLKRMYSNAELKESIKNSQKTNTNGPENTKPCAPPVSSASAHFVRPTSPSPVSTSARTRPYVQKPPQNETRTNEDEPVLASETTLPEASIDGTKTSAPLDKSARFTGYLWNGELQFHLWSSVGGNAHTMLTSKGVSITLHQLPPHCITFPTPHKSAKNRLNDEIAVNEPVCFDQGKKRCMGILRNFALGLALVQCANSEYKVALEQDLLLCDEDATELLKSLDDEKFMRKTEDKEPILIPSKSFTNAGITDALHGTSKPAPRHTPASRTTTKGRAGGSKKKQPVGNDRKRKGNNLRPNDESSDSDLTDENNDSEQPPQSPKPKRPKRAVLSKGEIDADVRIRSLILTFEQLQEDLKSDQARSQRHLAKIRREANERFEKLLKFLQDQTLVANESLLNRIKHLEAKVSALP